MAEPVDPATPSPILEVDDTPVMVIDGEGDIIFLVGPKEKQVQVHSLTMRRTSPVFDKMLGPNFSESQSLADSDTGSGPMKIKLPEDDPDAFIFTCSTVHGIPLQVMPDSQQLLDIAIVADKYDFAKALRFASQCWIQEFSDCIVSDDLWRVLVSAYMLDCARGFQQISRQLLLCHASSCWDLMKLTPRFDTAALLALAQDLVKKEIEDHITGFITNGVMKGLFARSSGCPSIDRSSYIFLSPLRAVGFLRGVGKVAVVDLVEVLEDISTASHDGHDNPISHEDGMFVASDNPTSVEKFKEMVRHQLTEVIDGAIGLCMLSLKNGVVKGGVPAQ